MNKFVEEVILEGGPRDGERIIIPVGTPIIEVSFIKNDPDTLGVGKGYYVKSRNCKTYKYRGQDGWIH